MSLPTPIPSYSPCHGSHVPRGALGLSSLPNRFFSCLCLLGRSRYSSRGKAVSDPTAMPAWAVWFRQVAAEVSSITAGFGSLAVGRNSVKNSVAGSFLPSTVTKRSSQVGERQAGRRLHRAAPFTAASELFYSTVVRLKGAPRSLSYWAVLHPWIGVGSLLGYRPRKLIVFMEEINRTNLKGWILLDLELFFSSL